MMTVLPVATFVKELLIPSQNGMTVIQCAKTMNPSLATDIRSYRRNLDPKLSRFRRRISDPISSVATTGLSSVEDPHLKRVDVRRDRYFVCLDTASTVQQTLRANGIHYAAKKAVYVQQVRSHALDELAFYGDKLLAFSVSDIVQCLDCGAETTVSVVWSGSKIAELAKDEGFRAAFVIFALCKNANQHLAPGMSVLVDFENLSPPPSAEESLMILRLYPSTGTLDVENPKATISHTDVCVTDVGYYDDYFLRGFRRGWYNDSLYFRCVGDRPSRFLSGGDASNSKRFNIREEHDFGYDNMRVMIELPDEGIVFCRGVGENRTDPEMACILFDNEGNVRDRYAYLGKLDRWSDIVQ